MKRMRLVAWAVQPVVMVDDGDNLTPVQVTVATIPGAQWTDFVEGGWKEQLDLLRAQIEGPPVDEHRQTEDDPATSAPPGAT